MDRRKWKSRPIVVCQQSTKKEHVAYSVLPGYRHTETTNNFPLTKHVPKRKVTFPDDLEESFHRGLLRNVTNNSQIKKSKPQKEPNQKRNPTADWKDFKEDRVPTPDDTVLMYRAMRTDLTHCLTIGSKDGWRNVNHKTSLEQKINCPTSTGRADNIPRKSSLDVCQVPVITSSSKLMAALDQPSASGIPKDQEACRDQSGTNKQLCLQSDTHRSQQAAEEQNIKDVICSDDQHHETFVENVISNDLETDQVNDLEQQVALGVDDDFSDPPFPLTQKNGLQYPVQDSSEQWTPLADSQLEIVELYEGIGAVKQSSRQSFQL